MSEYRERHCSTCGEAFSYKVSRGSDRKHCTAACRDVARSKAREIRKLESGPCSTQGCSGKATHRGRTVCETCSGRIRRTGSADQRKPAYRYTTGAGYIKLLRPDHPLSDASGAVFEHRLMVFEQLGPGAHPCFWCGVHIGWPDAVIDHLNEDKQDNSAANLAYSCNDCNRARGAVLPLIERMRPEALKTFLRCVQEHHDAKTARGE